MTDKLMFIPIYHTWNHPFVRLELVVEKFGHSTWWINHSKYSVKVPKVVKLTNKKTLL